jgi:hypothetical protein
MIHQLSNLWAVVATVLLAGCLAFDLRNGLYRILSGRNVVLVTVLVWYLLEALRVPADLTRYTPGEYDFGIFVVILSVGVFLATYQFAAFPLFAPLARRLPMLGQPRVLWLLVVGGMTIGIGSLLIYSGFDVMELFQGLTGMRRRWTGLARGRYGSWSTIIYELQMFLQATVPLAVALLFMKPAPRAQRWVAGLFVTWFFLRTFFSGHRGPLVPIVLALAAAIFWNAGPRLRRSLIYAGIPLALVGGYYWSAVIVAGRNAGQLDTSAAEKTDYVGFEMFRELLFVRRATERDLPLQWGLTYFTQLVNPIPRAIWPGKPVADAGLILARAYGAVDKNGEATLTNSPGFLGEAWLNFGFFGVLVIPAIAGILVRAWDGLFVYAKQSLPAFLVYAGGLATIVTSGRSFNLSNYYGLLALFVLMVAFEKMGFGAPQRVVPMRPPVVARRVSEAARQPS